MSKSLAQLRQSPRTSLPERSYTLCLSQAIVAEIQALETEKNGLEIEARRKEDDEDAPPAKRRKMGEGQNPRIDEIDARLEVLYDEMRQHEGQLLLRGETNGAWRRWCDANPARENGRDERGRPVILAIDQTVAYGYCNASALIDRLGDFAAAWNGEALETGDWAWLEEKAPPGDLKEMARWVVQMHEATGARAPFLSSGSSETQPNETA